MGTSNEQQVQVAVRRSSEHLARRHELASYSDCPFTARTQRASCMIVAPEHAFLDDQEDPSHCPRT